MLKRKNDYVMQVDVDVHYPFERLRAQSQQFAALPEREQREQLGAALAENVAPSPARS